MTTMAQAIKKFLEARGAPASSQEIRRHIEAEYAGQWQPRTLQAHLYGCVVNNPKAYVHHPSSERFLYKSRDGTFELYSEHLHGPNAWAPTGDDSDIESVEELVETSISLERDIEDHLIHHLEGIEKGLAYVDRQVVVDVGRIDILAKDANGQRVVIEVKVGEAKDSAVGQIARYLGWYARADGKPARGILVAAEFPDGVRYAATAIPNLKLIAYRVQFAFEPTTI